MTINVTHIEGQIEYLSRLNVTKYQRAGAFVILMYGFGLTKAWLTQNGWIL